MIQTIFSKAMVFAFSTALLGSAAYIAPADAMPMRGVHTQDVKALCAYDCDTADLIRVNTDGSKMGEGAQSFIQSMANRGIEFLGNDSLSMSQKKDSFRRLLRDSFDMKTIGRFSLGRYWRSSTPELTAEYARLFEKRVLDVHSQRFTEYKGQTFETRDYRVDSEKDTLVLSYIVPDEGPEVEVEWRVRYKNGRYMVVDVIVEGVSMSVTQRSDFSSVIQRGGGSVQALLTHLRSETSK